MKKKLLLPIIISLMAFLGGAVIVFLMMKHFKLSPEYYNTDGFHKIDSSELENLIDQKKSFALFIYQPSCRTSDDFEKILADFSQEYQVKFEKVAFSDIRKTDLVPGLQYYPSLALYRNGKLITFIKADSDEDLKIVTSKDGFTNWWKRYIKD